MSRQKPLVDLTGTSYDALETDLTQFLGLKVILVRGWTDSGAFSQASAKLQFARTQEAREEALKDYHSTKDAMLGSLRANITACDPAVGAELSENDLFALQNTGHITLRASNTQHEHAVLIFDPVSAPPQNVALFSISNDKNESMTFNIVAAPPEAALEWAFKSAFNNWWQGKRDHETDPEVKDLIENFDLDMEDVRRYQALVNVRYALRNQNEFRDRDRYYSETPEFFRFADIDERSPGMHKKYYDLRYSQVYGDLEFERRYKEEELGIKDPAFFEKIKYAGAIMNLSWNNLKPNNTFARLNLGYNANDEKIKEVMEDLRSRLENKVEETFGKSWSWGALQDWRIAFPVFRAVYEEDKSSGVAREYMDTIMAGLQKWFPTITNAPIPSRDCEPPRSLQKPAAKSAGPSPDPKP